jgi:hypothetical protein
MGFPQFAVELGRIKEVAFCCRLKRKSEAENLIFILSKITAAVTTFLFNAPYFLTVF